MMAMRYGRRGEERGGEGRRGEGEERGGEGMSGESVGAERRKGMTRGDTKRRQLEVRE
jgi:hypothetical protein